MQKTIIFTDLDGTLLDAASYSFADALPALQLLQGRGIPLILCSSKTRAEIAAWRRRIQNDHPFISENGGGIFIPRGYFSVPVEAETSNVTNHGVSPQRSNNHGTSDHRVPQVAAHPEGISFARADKLPSSAISGTAMRTFVREPGRSPQDVVPGDRLPSNGYQCLALGTPYAEIRQHFVALRARLGAKVRGFGDMNATEIAALTGLAAEDAVLAKQRDFDEPFIFEDGPDENFLREIEAAGLNWTQGRIFHILGRHDKGRAVRLLKELYAQEHGSILSIGLGDGLNDLPLLQAVEHPVLIRHEDGSFAPRIEIAGLTKTRQPGPRGWNEAVLQLLSAKNGGEKTSASGRQKQLRAIFNAALAAVDPYRAVLTTVSLENGHLTVADTVYPLEAFERVVVIGAGKATARMALAIEALLGERITAGLIVVKEDHTAKLAFVEQIEASHPVPNEAGVAGTQRILAMMRDADEKTLVICLLSGGGSALLVAPVAGVTLPDKQAVTTLLLQAGASIGELNAVRKHLSAVKGGRLAQAAFPARLVTLILSDVIGDRLDVIASGPTAPDTASFTEAWAVIEKYGLRERIPLPVANHLQLGMAGLLPETVKKGDPCLNATKNVIIGGSSQALAAAAAEARQLGFATEIISAAVQGEAREAARFLAQTARAAQMELPAGERRCLLSGGETTVIVRGSGKGGRNQELALAFALAAERMTDVALLSAGTDGGDGPTEAAGAMVDGNTAQRARRLGLEPAAYLEENNSYGFFQKFDALSGEHSHLLTGPTGTNVMDLQIILLENGNRSRGECPGSQITTEFARRA